MGKVIVTVWDDADEVKVQGQFDPPIDEPKEFYSTAEIIGMYLATNMGDVMRAAVRWSQAADNAPVEDAVIKAPKLILPGDTGVKQ